MEDPLQSDFAGRGEWLVVGECSVRCLLTQEFIQSHSLTHSWIKSSRLMALSYMESCSHRGGSSPYQ